MSNVIECLSNETNILIGKQIYNTIYLLKMINFQRYRFEREQEDRTKKYIQIFRNYRSSTNPTFVTEKFYSKYDRMGGENETEEQRNFKNKCILEKSTYLTPQQKNSLPVTENQMYGWLWDKGCAYDELDSELFCHHRQTDEVMRIENEVNKQLTKLKRK